MVQKNLESASPPFPQSCSKGYDFSLLKAKNTPFVGEGFNFLHLCPVITLESHQHFYGPLNSGCSSATDKSLQSCPTLCDPIPGILQARTLEWAAISFSNA